MIGRRLLAMLGRDRGQTIFLAPIGLMIVVILGGTILEAGALHLRQRQLDDLADSIASDAAAVAFDVEQFRLTGDLTIDPDRANAMVGPSIQISSLPEATPAGVSVQVDGGIPEIAIELSFEHEFIFARQVFGATTELRALGRAELVPSQ